MAYVAMFAGWVALWYRPTAANFNLFGLIVALVLLISVAISNAILPGSFRDSMLWSVAILGVYLVVGAAIMAFRNKGSHEERELLPQRRLEPIARKGFAVLVPRAAAGGGLMAAAIALGGIIGGQGLVSLWVAAFGGVALFAVGFVPAGLFWLVAVIIDAINQPPKQR